jgi:hypothetical protein
MIRKDFVIGRKQVVNGGGINSRIGRKHSANGGINSRVGRKYSAIGGDKLRAGGSQISSLS